MSPDSDDLQAIRVGLESDDPVVRARALERLDAVIAGRAHEIVAEALQSENPVVRDRAAALRVRLDRPR